jgi:hypothetical protein
MTAENVPYDLTQKCTFLMSQDSCTIDLHIDFDKQQTTLNVSSSMDYMETSIKAVASIEIGLKYTKQISFWCSDPHGGCNDEHYLTRVLQSVTTEGSFKELEPLLIPTNQTIDNSSCLLFSNMTFILCPTECDEDSKACFIRSITDEEKSLEVCARCSPMNNYYLTHSMTFFINNLSVSQTDHRALLCAVPECNSIANLERIRQLVTINFDSAKFFSSSTTTVPSKTTIPSASGLLFSENKLARNCNLFIFLIMSFIYNIILS